MSKYFPAGLALGALLGSAAFLAPMTGFAQGKPPAAASPQSSAPAATPPQSDASKSSTSTADDQEKARAAKKAFFDAKLAALHAGLALTPAQEPQWAPVETAIRGLWHGHDKDHAAQEDKATPLDRLKHRSTWLAERAKALSALTDATGPLVASLDAAQKERLPKLLGGAFKGREVLFAAFNVASEDREDGHGAQDHEQQDGEGHHAWHRGHNDSAEGHGGQDRADGRRDEQDGEGGHWHHHHHWHHRHHHHHWGHHQWGHGDEDRGEHHRHNRDHDQDSGSGEQHGHHHQSDENGDRT